jgi:hypothetical protein
MKKYTEKPIRNMLSFEVEDTFHVDSPNFDSGDEKSRIIPILIHLLNLLDNFNVRATFFILGSVASKFPEIVTLLDSRGHEVASHGFSHRELTGLEPENLESEIRLSKETLENILKRPIMGFKSAGDPLEKDHIDILNVISNAGYLYDCSTRSGIFAGKSTNPFDISFKDERSMVIVPQSAARRFRVWLRFGENLRLYPSWFTIKSITDLNRRGSPALINMKLWEFDKHQFRNAGADFLSYRRYGNLNFAEEKFLKILGMFEFGTCARVLGLGS